MKSFLNPLANVPKLKLNICNPLFYQFYLKPNSFFYLIQPLCIMQLCPFSSLIDFIGPIVGETCTSRQVQTSLFYVFSTIKDLDFHCKLLVLDLKSWQWQNCRNSVVIAFGKTYYMKFTDDSQMQPINSACHDFLLLNNRIFSSQTHWNVVWFS